MTDNKLVDSQEVNEADLERVKKDADAKLMRHRLDDYVAIILGVGSCIILWLFQLVGWY